MNEKNNELQNQIVDLKSEITELKNLIYTVNKDVIDNAKKTLIKKESLTPIKKKKFEGYAMFSTNGTGGIFPEDGRYFIYNLCDLNFKFIDEDQTIRYKWLENQPIDSLRTFNEFVDNYKRIEKSNFRDHNFGKMVFKIKAQIDFNKKCLDLSSLEILDIYARESFAINNYILDIENMKVLNIYREFINTEHIKTPVNSLDLHPTNFYNLLEKHHEAENHIVNGNNEGWFPFLYYNNRFFKILEDQKLHETKVNILKEVDTGTYNKRDMRFTSDNHNVKFIEPDQIYIGYARFYDEDQEVELMFPKLINYNEALIYKNSPDFIKEMIDQI